MFAAVSTCSGYCSLCQERMLPFDAAPETAVGLKQQINEKKNKTQGLMTAGYALKLCPQLGLVVAVSNRTTYALITHTASDGLWECVGA